MKLTIKTGICFDKPCIIATAKTRISGRRIQKTWRLQTVAPEFTLTEQTPALEAEARRWEHSILNPAIQKPPVQEGLL